MKKLTLLLLLIGTGFNTLQAQSFTPLFAGIRNSNELVTVDTTGGTFTVVASIDMATDVGIVNGTYGLALDPTTDNMYILYDNGNYECNRHLGIVNVVTGDIIDIGDVGNLVDIDFGPDGTLYGTTGASCAAEYSFVEINKLTASYSVLFDHVSSDYGSSIAYNPFSSEMFHINNDDYSRIDLGTLVETLETESPDETHAIAFLRADLAWAISYEELYTFNPITGDFNYVEDLDEDYHALSFGLPSCVPLSLEVTSFSVCIGGEITLDATSESGADILWDGGIFDDVAFTPAEVGLYTYTATSLDDDDCALPVEIEVLALPVILPGAGDENFCEDEPIVLSAGGDADEYSWDPLDLNPGIGVHTYTLTGARDGGCINSATIDITVHALPVIEASVDPILTCIGGDVTFSATGATTYVWDDAGIETDVPFTTDASGTLIYTVTGTDINGCINSSNVTLTVAEDINITGVTSEEVEGGDGGVSITISGGVPAYTVDWDNDGTGDFDDPASISGLSGGVYTVVVQGSMGCSGTETFTIDSQLSIGNFDENSISLYPNPTVNMVTIEMNGAFSFQVVNINGQTIHSGNAVNKTIVNMESLADGIYYFNVNATSETISIPVVKK